MRYPICVGITGASGAIYAVRLLEVLSACGRDVYLSISPSGRDVIRQELDLKIDLDQFMTSSLMLGDDSRPGDSKLEMLKSTAGISTGDSNVLGDSTGRPGKILYHPWQDFSSPIASGSFLTGGMVICPCSGTTLSAVAAGAAANLIQRAAEVHLKERRPLVLVPRETPLSLAHIDNMRRVKQAGAVVLPAAPGWYHGVSAIQDLVDFIVGRICDQLGIANALMKRWGGQ